MACVDFLKLVVKSEFKTTINTPQIIQLMLPSTTMGLSAKPALIQPELINIQYYINEINK